MKTQTPRGISGGARLLPQTPPSSRRAARGGRRGVDRDDSKRKGVAGRGRFAGDLYRERRHVEHRKVEPLRRSSCRRADGPSLASDEVERKSKASQEKKGAFKIPPSLHFFFFNHWLEEWIIGPAHYFVLRCLHLGTTCGGKRRFNFIVSTPLLSLRHLFLPLSAGQW